MGGREGARSPRKETDGGGGYERRREARWRLSILMFRASSDTVKTRGEREDDGELTKTKNGGGSGPMTLHGTRWRTASSGVKKPRTTATAAAGRAPFPTRSKRELLLRARDEIAACSRVRNRVRPRLELEEGDTSEERAHGVSERREGRCVAALGQLAC